VDVVVVVVMVVAMAFAPVAQLVLMNRWITRLRARPSRVRARRRRAPVPRPAVRLHRRRLPVTARRPLELVAADLRRLSAQLASVPAGAPMVRWRALWSAFDVVLVEAAELLEVPQALLLAPLGPARDVERLRVVALLEDAGLVVVG
jgi:hypothetical protein